MKAIRIHEVGGPEVLIFEDLPDPSPAPGQVVIDIQAVGVNITDVNTRSGVNPPRSIPLTLGIEAAGVVSAVGDGVTDLRGGDRVACYWGAMGSYAERSAVPADKVVKLPDRLDVRAGAAALVQGMTAHYLAYSTYPLKPGDSCVVHAGAGGTGLLLIQMAKRAGAYVFATVSTDEKAALAQEAGSDRTIIYTREDFEEEVNKATDGRGVQVVYDSVGRTTFDKSLNCLAPRGCLALYGHASGPVTAVSEERLAEKSVFLTRPGLPHYIADREELLRRAGEVFDWIASGELKLRIGGTFPLADAAEAHRQMESRNTTGKLLLIP
ncbi:MAG: quinone oxidoreductase [Dehalococcoidia bacterium]|nr:quinone oxidoreductase [Dehalococcoidia bacterium]